MSKRRRYKPEGAEAFFSKGKNKQYPEDLRKAAVMDYQAGTGSLREICSKCKIREKTQLRMWIEMYNGHIEIRTTGGLGIYADVTREFKKQEFAGLDEFFKGQRSQVVP